MLKNPVRECLANRGRGAVHQYHRASGACRVFQAKQPSTTRRLNCRNRPLRSLVHQDVARHAFDVVHVHAATGSIVGAMNIDFTTWTSRVSRPTIWSPDALQSGGPALIRLSKPSELTGQTQWFTSVQWTAARSTSSLVSRHEKAVVGRPAPARSTDFAFRGRPRTGRAQSHSRPLGPLERSQRRDSVPEFMWRPAPRRMGGLPLRECAKRRWRRCTELSTRARIRVRPGLRGTSSRLCEPSRAKPPQRASHRSPPARWTGECSA